MACFIGEYRIIFELGKVYLLLDKNKKEVIVWFKKSAKQDFRKAVDWYLKAANQGNYNAQTNYLRKKRIGI